MVRSHLDFEIPIFVKKNICGKSFFIFFFFERGEED